MRKTTFHKKSGKVSEEVINGIRREYQNPPDHLPFSLVDAVLVGLRQVDLLQEIKDILGQKNVPK